MVTDWASSQGLQLPSSMAQELLRPWSLKSQFTGMDWELELSQAKGPSQAWEGS